LCNALFGPTPSASALVAFAEGKPVGYAIYFFTFSTFTGKPGVYLEDVYVRPAYRRQGVGQALMRSVAQAGVERDCGRYEWSALRWNENALRLYRELGARTLDEWVLLRMNEGQLRHMASGNSASTPAK
jgi:GNAT superfamily N-acetyltransferase